MRLYFPELPELLGAYRISLNTSHPQNISQGQYFGRIDPSLYFSEIGPGLYFKGGLYSEKYGMTLPEDDSVTRNEEPEVVGSESGNRIFLELEA